MAPMTGASIAPQRREAIESLFVANVDVVFNVAFRVLWNRSDAEDVVQRSFLKALSRLDQLMDTSRARPWLLQIAYRESIALLRARRELRTDPCLIPEESTNAGPAERAVAADLTQILSDALRRIDAHERMAVVLREIEQLPMREVAGVTGLGLSAAKMRVHRGRAALRVLIADQEVR